MRCEKCKKSTATVRMQQVANGTKKDIYLCGDCSGEIEITMLIENIFNGIFSNVKNNLIEQAKTESAADSKLTCPQCDMTLGDLKNDGNIGCAGCYESFFEQLKPVIAHANESHIHEGKYPKRGAAALEHNRVILKLKFLMQLAVEEEDFDKAAHYRDRIKFYNHLAKIVQSFDHDEEDDYVPSPRNLILDPGCMDAFCSPESDDKEGIS